MEVAEAEAAGHRIRTLLVAPGLGWAVPTKTQKLESSAQEAEERPVAKLVGHQQEVDSSAVLENLGATKAQKIADFEEKVVWEATERPRQGFQRLHVGVRRWKREAAVLPGKKAEPEGSEGIHSYLAIKK